MSLDIEDIIYELKIEEGSARETAGKNYEANLFNDAIAGLEALEEAREIIDYAQEIFSFQPDLQLTDSEGRGDGQINEIMIQINKFKEKFKEKE